MKNKDKNKHFYSNKTAISHLNLRRRQIVLSLANISLISVGFCSWMVVGQSATVGPIDVAVGNIVSSDAKKLTDLGFSVDNSVSTSIKSLKITNGDTTTSTYIEPACLKAGIKIDTDKLSQINNDDDLLLKIQFKFLNSGSNPSIDGLKIYPSNYEYFSFDALKTTNTHLLNTFYYPIKTGNRMCLYDLAKLDSTYPKYPSAVHPNYEVPLTLSFSLSNITSDFLNSTTASYQVIYSLTTKGVNA